MPVNREKGRSGTRTQLPTSGPAGPLGPSPAFMPTPTSGPSSLGPLGPAAPGVPPLPMAPPGGAVLPQLASVAPANPDYLRAFEDSLNRSRSSIDDQLKYALGQLQVSRDNAAKTLAAVQGQAGSNAAATQGAFAGAGKAAAGALSPDVPASALAGEQGALRGALGSYASSTAAANPIVAQAVQAQQQAGQNSLYQAAIAARAQLDAQERDAALQRASWAREDAWRQQQHAWDTDPAAGSKKYAEQLLQFGIEGGPAQLEQIRQTPDYMNAVQWLTRGVDYETNKGERGTRKLSPDELLTGIGDQAHGQLAGVGTNLDVVHALLADGLITPEQYQAFLAAKGKKVEQKGSWFGQ